MKTILNFIKKNRNIILLIISFVFLTMLVLGMTYAYFDLKTGGETESTMNIGGAEISATYSFWFPSFIHPSKTLSVKFM